MLPVWQQLVTEYYTTLWHSGRVSASGLDVAKGPSMWVVATSFEHPTPLVGFMPLVSPVLLVLALQFLLQLHS